MAAALGTGSTDVAGRRPRFEWIDSLRVLAVIGVVTQHACITHWMADVGIGWGARALLGVASGSVALLMLVAGYLSTLGKDFGTQNPSYVLRRAQRLLIPYVAWSAIYYVLQTFAPYGQGVPPLTIWDLLQGTGIYVVLWFLPAMFYSSVAGWAIRSQRVRLAVAFLALLWYLARNPIATVVPPALESLFAFTLYLAPWLALFLLGQASASIPEGWLASRGVGVLLATLGVAAAVTAALICAANYPAWPGPTPDLLWLSASTGVGMGMLFARRYPHFNVLPTFSRVSLGIYMMHLPLLSLIGRVVPAGVVPWFVWIPLNVAVVVAVVGGLSVAIARTPLRVLVT